MMAMEDVHQWDPSMGGQMLQESSWQANIRFEEQEDDDDSGDFILEPITSSAQRKRRVRASAGSFHRDERVTMTMVGPFSPVCSAQLG